MKILILGGDGMIGHKMDQVLSVQNHEIVISIREKKDFLFGIYKVEKL